MKKDLITRLNEGPVLCAEGYLFAMERRGYLSAGAFVPEVVLNHPEVLSQLHREFINQEVKLFRHLLIMAIEKN
jgi:hypothetical protein